ncbi:PREDICTED: uncharacterized protein LOC108547430 [Eufriesea mexicana]|uniref:uncharacterized protein LOC108547430 n=1 Tax=Eufriesea mexicana TaxID=516756 RepID=UPI00083BF96F|nr:PREDICTED: uncharacterized protein LOC108547430 [Eufriesea mexicana]
MHCKIHYYITLSLMYNLIFMFCLIALTESQKVHNASRTDLMKCKLTQLGMEYRGAIAKTAGDIRCQYWYTDEPIHEVSKDITDNDFPEKSMKIAKNYCRNPTRDSRGPWCYTLEPSLIDDECDIPLLHNASRTDLMKCKLTQLGMEYRGAIAKTAGDIRCQYWYTDEPIHEVSKDITDNDFPEKSMKIAKNYCRNPTRDSRGPWCYTLEPSLIDDECDIPLCNFGECKLSGPGSEYGGSKEMTTSRSKCKSWHKRHQLEGLKSEKYDDKNFPDRSRRKAGNFCRNPSGDVGGPWCYVEEENLEYVQKQYCDIPFCDDRGCLSFTKNSSSYTILTKLYPSSGNISFWMKLWNPDDEKMGEVRILLSLLSVPVSAKVMAEEWTAGVELLLANSGSRQTFPTIDEEESFENTPEILVGAKWTGIWITWGGGFISLGVEGSFKPLVMQEYKKKLGITSLYPESFLYYGLRGTNVLWSGTLCETHCEMHTTFGTDFSKVWTMQRSNDTIDIRVFVRASQNIHIRLYQTPSREYPSVTVTINKVITTLTYQESEESSKHYLKEVPTTNLLDFWSWREFSISIFGGHFRLFSHKHRGAIELLYRNENFFSTLRWFSIGSENTIAQWTLFCSPEESDAIEDPWPPNCISDIRDFQYKGTQWTSIDEIPCVPWISAKIPAQEKIDQKFIDGSALKAMNKCRNPTYDSNGAYCYAYTPWKDVTISKRYCSIRNCRSSDCRMAGTANDYMGTLSKTRSGRICRKWPIGLESAVTSMPIMSRSLKTSTVAAPRVGSTVFQEYFNDTLYPEGSAKNASNYCRNPSRNIAGAWCYTTDPSVPMDLCNVRDCEKPDEYTFLVKGDGVGRRIYVLPEYRSEGLHFSLKAWEPDNPDSVTFVFLADDGLKSRYILKIGSISNENVLLLYQSETAAVSLVKKKVLPHLLYVGKWSSFIIRIPRGQFLLYYEDDPKPLFEWTHPDPPNAFLPMYYYYGTELGKAVGFAFDHDSNCHIENTRTDRYTRILSLSTWIDKVVVLPEKVTLQLRGKGGILLPLYLTPANPGYFMLKLNDPDRWIMFTRNTYPSVTVFHKQKAQVPLFTTNSWTNITIRWSGNIMNIYSNATNVFHYQHISPLVFYFFSVGVDSGNWITWSVNCIPTVDGGWSEWGPWACSASCNGGTGTRKRRCESPKPNIRGEPCVGPSTMTGRCNEILCGDITEDTVNLINRRIRMNYTAFTVKEHNSITIKSDSDIVKLITTESPRSELQWSLNGVFIEVEPERLELKDYNIEIIKAVLNDSGVYAMTLRRIDGTYSIIKVISLAVIPARENIQIRETLSTTIQCHCAILGHIYSELQVSWLLHNKIWKDYGLTLPVAADIEYITKINKTHNGMWQCIVKQNDLGFKWITNMIYFKVLGPPNWRTHLMEDQATRFFFGWLPNEDYVGIVVIVLFLVIVAAIIGGSYYYIRFRETMKGVLDLRNVPRSPRGSEYEPLTDEVTTEDPGTTEDQATSEDQGTTEDQESTPELQSRKIGNFANELSHGIASDPEEKTLHSHQSLQHRSVAEQSLKNTKPAKFIELPRAWNARENLN